jgi:predicted NAD/FAD-binding protein
MDKKVAIIGSGISGLAAAHALCKHADVALFEAGSYFGGHTHTVDITLPTINGAVTHGVDTGFLVFNERTYPHLIKLFADLGVKTAKSDMSFSVQVPQEKGSLEWSGTNLSTVFAQRSNLVNLRFWRMLRDLMRFNKLATDIAESGGDAQLMQPLQDFLQTHKFSAEFRDWYLLPMLGCIWSCPTSQMLQFHSGGQWQAVPSITLKKSLPTLQTNGSTRPFMASHATAEACTLSPTPAKSDLTKSSSPPIPTKLWPCLSNPAKLKDKPCQL